MPNYDCKKRTRWRQARLFKNKHSLKQCRPTHKNTQSSCRQKFILQPPTNTASGHLESRRVTKLFLCAPNEPVRFCPGKPPLQVLLAKVNVSCDHFPPKLDIPVRNFSEGAAIFVFAAAEANTLAARGSKTGQPTC